MHGHENSHSPIVLTTLTNKAACASVYAVDDNHRDLHSFPTRRSSDLQSRKHMSSALERIRQAARSERSEHCYHSHSRSEEHTSELQSLTKLVCCLLLEVKKDAREGGPYRDDAPVKAGRVL